MWATVPLRNSSAVAIQGVNRWAGKAATTTFPNNSMLCRRKPRHRRRGSTSPGATGTSGGNGILQAGGRRVATIMATRYVLSFASLRGRDQRRETLKGPIGRNSDGGALSAPMLAENTHIVTCDTFAEFGRNRQTFDKMVQMWSKSAKLLRNRAKVVTNIAVSIWSESAHTRGKYVLQTKQV